MVQLSNYQDGSGDLGGQEVDQLLKAMQAGQITGRDTTGLNLTGEPLKVESLETTLRLLDFRMKDIQLYNDISKLPATNTVEEYLQLVSYGADRGGFYDEGELSDVEDSIYRRKAVHVKYIGVTREITLQAQMVRSHVDVMKQEMENGTMWVLRKANKSIWHADSTMVPQEFDGLRAQHANIGVGDSFDYANIDAYENSSCVIDLRGGSLKQGNVEDAAQAIDANFGNVGKLYAPPSVIGGLAKDYYERQRILLGAAGYTGEAGANPKAIDTTFGSVALAHDKSMKKSASKTLASPAESSKAPLAPTVSAAALSGADAGSKFSTAEGGLGTVYYAVSAINRFGESALSVAPDATTPITLTNGQSVDISFTSGGGAVPATSYRIYRSKVTAATNASTQGVVFYPLFTVSAAQLAAGFDGGAAGAVRDRNRHLPDTEECFISEMTPEVMYLKQLGPISKLNLAVTGPSNRFMVYGWMSTALVAPKKMVIVKNIGPYVAS